MLIASGIGAHLHRLHHMRVTANDVRHALTEKPVGELSLRRHRLQRVFHAPVHTCDNGVGVHALRLGNVDSHLLLVDIVHHIRLTGGNAVGAVGVVEQHDAETVLLQQERIILLALLLIHV